MPSIGSCLGKRRAVGIPSGGTPMVFLENEMHSSFPFDVEDR
jgi:hypothetical protein